MYAFPGFPAGWKKAGPLPLLFFTPSALFGSLFGPLRNGNAVKGKKRKVKNGQMLIMEGGIGVTRI
jgi:hypothetical protein